MVIIMKYMVPITPAINSKFINDIEKKIFYLSDLIINYKINSEDGYICELELELDDVPDDNLAKKINLYIQNQFAKKREMPVERVWERHKNTDLVKDVFDNLNEKELAIDMGIGLIGLEESFTDVMWYIDDFVKNIGKKKFNAVEYTYPTLIEYNVIKKSGYQKMFPHLLIYLSKLHNDVEYFNKIVDENNLFTNDLEKDNLCHCLPPAVCYHVYSHMSKKEREYPQAITTVGKAFRHESKYAKRLERLWDFTQREIVFLGSSEYVNESRKHAMNEVFYWLEKMGIDGYCETASDPFFIEASATGSDFVQKLMKMKYELCLPIGNGKYLPVASFNIHNQYIGNAFDLKDKNDNVVYTGCVSFGLERIAYALLCQLGLDKEKWPFNV